VLSILLLLEVAVVVEEFMLVEVVLVD